MTGERVSKYSAILLQQRPDYLSCCDNNKMGIEKSKIKEEEHY